MTLPVVSITSLGELDSQKEPLIFSDEQDILLSEEDTDNSSDHSKVMKVKRYGKNLTALPKNVLSFQMMQVRWRIFLQISWTVSSILVLSLASSIHPAMSLKML